jgi:cellulose biosynthesis protein BcsQ
MSLGDLIDVLELVSKEYGSVILGALTLIFSIVYGGRYYQRLVKHRIDDLEGQIDTAKKQIGQYQAEIDTQKVRLELTEKDRNASSQRLARIRHAFSGSDDQNIWLGAPIIQPDRYHDRMRESIPILLIANLKGGVGKSTIAANLVPYFEREKNESVLAIDLDYQGSLSSMLLPEPYNRQARPAQTLKDLMCGKVDNLAMLAMSRPIRDTTRDSRIIDCDGPFANFETRLLIQWLSGEVDGDIRYGLAKALLDPAIQKRFQRIIIDAPPRMTTGFVNALCASTHLIVPFVLDTLSSERVGLFISQLQRMRPQLFPHLNLAGVVGTMKRTDTEQIGDTERAAFNEAKTRVQLGWGSSEYVLTGAPIPRKQSIADAAGLRIAYNEAADAESIFKRLGSHIIVRAPGRQHANCVASEAAE